MAEKFYITTPIYYPSAKLTLGNCYTTVVCDAIARFNKMLGSDVFFLTGTDEHGQKIEKVAKEKGVSEMEHLNAIIADTKSLWEKLQINYDMFIRTTDEFHEKTVQKIFKTLFDKGEIYKAHYTGKYCTPCESFWTEEQLINGKCPDCGRDVYDADEECYNFRLSAYTDKILELYKNNPNFLEPQSRVNEMVNNFLKDGLKDLCVTRK
ncbi:MAG: class I tRNA ligase family protein, partial [Clostridia bacterium]